MPKIFGGGGGGGGGAVVSVFGRAGVVIAVGGDYSGSQITNDSGVAGLSVSDALDTLDAPISLIGTRVTVGPANSFLASDGISNQWLPQFTGPANPGDNGKVVIASAGNFTYFAGSVLGQALTWNSGTNTWEASTDFGANAVTTTGSVVVNNGAGFMRLGLAPGSGGVGFASAAATGTIRGARGTNGFVISIRNNLDSGDISVMSTDTVAGTLTVGSTGAGGFGASLAAPSASSADIRAGSIVCAVSSSGFACTGLNIQFNASVASGTFRINTNATNGVTGVVLNIAGQDCSGTTTNGGALNIRPGQGTSSSGLGRLNEGTSSAQRFGWNTTGIGLYAKAPVAQAARVGQAIDSTTGTPSGTRTFVDVTTASVADPVKINNNFATLVANMWNLLETAISNIGVTA